VWFEDVFGLGTTLCPGCGTEGQKSEGDVLSRTIAALKRRADLTDRLVAALAHLDRDQAIAIVSSWIPLDELQDLVEFQENR
jgi:hypothetical protein